MGLRNLALSVFFGGGLATILATRAIFRAAESRKQAGDFSGRVLRSFELLRATALLALFASLFLDMRGVGVAIVLALLMAGGALVDRTLRKLRDDLGADPADPRRKRFGSLHGVSVSLLAVQIGIAGANLALR